MNTFNLKEKELDYLHALHRLTKDKWSADRIKAIIALGGTWTLEEVSEILLLDTETLRNYIRLYTRGGVEELTKRHYKGSVGKLSDSQENSLKEHLNEITHLTATSVKGYVKTTYGVSYTLSGITKLLKSLGFVYKKPDIAPGRVDVSEQLKFLQQFEELKRSGHPIYSMDGCHPQHNSMPQYGWILKGHTKRLPSNTGRKRINIQGAVRLDSHEWLSTVHDTLDKNSTIALLKKINRANPTSSKVYVLVDNAGYYRAQKVMEYLKSSKIEFIFLPPYSPNLSLIERVWRYLKQKLLYNRYYATFQEFKTAITDFLRRSHRRPFKKLLVEKFHFARLNTSTIQLYSP